MNKGLILLCIVLVLVSAGAFAPAVKNESIEVVIDKEGMGRITENYNLSFLAGEMDDFKAKVEEYGSSLLIWSTNYEWFYPKIAPGGIKRSYITFDEKEKVLILDYYLNSPIATKEADALRSTTWVVSDSVLSPYYSGGAIIIPDDVELKIVLPAGSEINSSKISNQAVIFGNTIILSGITTSNMTLEYSVPKPIAPEINLQILLTQTNILTAVAVILLAGLVIYWKRAIISEKIEGYVVKNSKIETHFHTEDEIDLE